MSFGLGFLYNYSIIYILYYSYMNFQNLKTKMTNDNFDKNDKKPPILLEINNSVLFCVLFLKNNLEVL